MIDIIRTDNRAAWLAARGQDVTASVAGALLGVHPYVTRYGLWAEKTGRMSPDAQEENDAMERGILSEPVVVAMVRKRRPDWNVIYEDDRAYYRDPNARIGCTPDAFVDIPGVIGRGNLQLKTASEEAFKKYWLDAETGVVTPPTWIAIQAIVEAKLTGCTYAKVALLVFTWRATFKLHIVDIPLHDRLWARLKDEVEDFWRMIDAGKEPNPDFTKDVAAVIEVYRSTRPERKDLSGDDMIDRLLEEFEGEKAIEKLAKKNVERCRAQILHKLGHSEAGATAKYLINASTNQFGGRTLRITKKDVFDGSF